MTLHEYLEKQNQQAKDYMDANPGSWISTTTTNEKHWNEYGVYTVEDYKRYILICTISDCFKDRNGVRPRHIDFNNMSIPELEKFLKEI